MPILTALDWPIRILLGVIVAGALGAGVVLAVRTSGDGDAGVVAQVTETATAPAPTDTPAPPTPTITEPAPTQLPPTQPPATRTLPPATPDTRVAIRDLPTVDQIQLGKDGKYFIADRGDGCTWFEQARIDVEDGGDIVVLHTDCPVDFGYTYEPNTGSVSLLMP